MSWRLHIVHRYFSLCLTALVSVGYRWQHQSFRWSFILMDRTEKKKKSVIISCYNVIANCNSFSFLLSKHNNLYIKRLSHGIKRNRVQQSSNWAQPASDSLFLCQKLDQDRHTFKMKQTILCNCCYGSRQFHLVTQITDQCAFVNDPQKHLFFIGYRVGCLNNDQDKE